MANVIINDVNLTNIANAIRGKNGSSDTYKPSEMADAITNLPSGGGGGSIEVEPVVLSGNCTYACSGAMPSQYIELFGDTVSTQAITNANNMFSNYVNSTIPFDINFRADTIYKSMTSMFQGANIVEVPKIYNAYPDNMERLFFNCKYLKSIPEDLADNINFKRVQTYNYAGLNQMFASCHSLRKIPANFIKNMYGVQSSTSYLFYSSAFANCYSLDEINELPVHQAAPITSGVMSFMFDCCYRLKSFTFAVNEDGTPKTADWKSQTLGLHVVGHMPNAGYLYGDLTTDTQITDAATYEALKDSPDSWTTLRAYSRYNRTSAVETINSLPDTSAYLASKGGTNTVKFEGEAGSATDGGAINTMTEEEIAVATAKGWTVSFV